MSRTTWLDGLRGIAAAIVATDHYFMGGVLDVAFRSFWADPPEENRRLIQLPPIRLLFAAHAMVPLFLVISGYAISINLLRARGSGNADDFLRRMSSTVTRRVLRIYLPVFCIAVISQFLFFCNIFQWKFGDEVTWGRRPWTAPWFHITFIFRYMLDNMNILTFQYNDGFNGQLWTMALEFRGSCIVYLLILGLAFWRPGLRRLALLVLMAYWFYFGLWDVVGFLAGLYLAEGQIMSESLGMESALAGLPSFVRPMFGANKARVAMFATVWTYVCFIMGFWLVCLSDDGFLPPGYQFLEVFASSRWDNNWGVINKTWKTVGSALVIYAIGKSPYLQRPLNTAPVQFLGKVSFSLYLVHQTVYHLVRNPVRDALWYVMTGEQYTWGASERPVPYAITWIGGYIILAPLNLYVANLYTRFIDDRCVDLARRFEKLISQ